MDKHHIVKQQIFEKGRVLEKYKMYKNCKLNLLIVDHNIHINALHSQSKKNVDIREKCYNQAVFELHKLKLDTLDIDSFNILKSIYIWSIIDNWDKTKKDTDLLKKYGKVLKKYHEL